MAIVADGWTSTLPLDKLPATYNVPGNIDAAAVMELPLGRSIRRDTAAMYRTTHHQKPTPNGYGSYAPLSYHILRTALNSRDHTALDAVASLGPVLIAANDGDPTNPWSPFVASYSSAVRIGNDANWTLFRLPRGLPSTTTRCDGPPVPITAIFDEQKRIDSAILTDRNPETGWESPHRQRSGDRLTLQLAGERRLCGIVLSMGPLPGCYPRSLRVATALGSGVWEVRFRRRMGGPRSSQLSRIGTTCSYSCPWAGRGQAPSSSDSKRRIPAIPRLSPTSSSKPSRERHLIARRVFDIIATFCLLDGHALLHSDRDFDAFEEELALRVVHPYVLVPASTRAAFPAYDGAP